MVLGAFANAVVTSAAFPRVWSGAPHLCSRRAFVRFSLPGSPDHSVHFVLAATACAARIASHSFGETTATRLAFLTTFAVGNCFLSISPTETNVEPSVAGRTMRAWSMPGNLTSQLHCVFAVTLSRIAGIGKDVPTTLYWLIGFIGGSPATTNPSMPS